jgi:hypothetical protein
MKLDDRNAAFPHLGHEVEVIALGILHPQHIVEEQIVTIGWGEPAMGQPRGTHQDFAELADLGMGAQGRNVWD